MTGIGDSTGKPVARDIRDTDQSETGNDELENPEECETNSNEIKTSCAIEKAERETPTDLEHMESDELATMGTSSTANKRK